ncbi:MAG: hypothetical protein FWF31_01815 [Desulfobulbus sp.]|nr:hypothetical protein [Desulfobulbus sp.]
MRFTGKMGKPLNNQDGIALVTALMLGMFGMLMVAALLFMVNTGTWTSGSQARRQTALAAAHGANNFFAKEVLQRGIEGTSLSAMGAYNGMLSPVDAAAFATKLDMTGRSGDATGYPNNPVDAVITFTSPTGGPDIIVNATLTSTKRGNSGASSDLLMTGGVVANDAGTVTPQHFPFLYQIRVDGQRAAGPLQRVERARLNSLYMY